MANMSYCRFENTLDDLQDCYDNMEDDDLNEYEIKARKRLVKLCQTIAQESKDYDFMDED